MFNQNGVINGAYRCHVERDNELNKRLYSRNTTTAPLQAHFSSRPVSTKYATMPIVDQVRTPVVGLEKRPIFNSEKMFNPGNSMGPWEGYSSKVDNESSIRNQFFANQSCPQGKFIPSSSSDMYVVKMEQEENQYQPHQELFRPIEFQPFNPNTNNLPNELFYNHTRQQRLDA